MIEINYYVYINDYQNSVYIMKKPTSILLLMRISTCLFAQELKPITLNAHDFKTGLQEGIAKLLQFYYWFQIFQGSKYLMRQ